MIDLKERTYLVSLVKQRFAPMTRFLGPPYAGEIEIDGLSGPLWLGEGPLWIWGVNHKRVNLASQMSK